MRKYIFHSDPSHEWLQVSISVLRELGILDKISEYSYTDGVNAFLEGDCDAGTFAEAMAARGLSFEVEERHIDREHWIRALPRLRK